MTVQRRHGLRTLPVPTGAAGTGLDQLVSGRRTAVVRPVADDGEVLERPGDRLIVTDGRGRAVAVVEVRDITLATLASVLDDVRLADDPDAPSREAWATARCREWGRDPGSPEAVPVVALRLHVVGLEESPTTAGPGPP